MTEVERILNKKTKMSQWKKCKIWSFGRWTNNAHRWSVVFFEKIHQQHSLC